MVEVLSEESAKAIGKVADASGKAIDAGREFGGFFSRHFGGSVEQWAGLWEDKLRYRRWENQVALMQKAEARIKELGLEGRLRPLEMKIGIPLLEAASLETDNFLRDRWADLLVNAVSGPAEKVHIAFVDILKSFSLTDAYVLDALYTYKQENDAKLDEVEKEHPLATLSRDQKEEREYERRVFAYEGKDQQDQGKKEKAQQLSKIIEERFGQTFTPDQIEISLFNLYRLNCLHLVQVMGGWPSPEHIYFLRLGAELHNACTLEV